VNLLYNAQPSQYIAVFSIAQTAPTLEAAVRFASERVMGFKRELSRFSDTSSIHLDVVSIMPTYELEAEKKVFSRRFVETPNGFEVKQNLHIPISSEKILPSLVSIAAKHEIYDFVKLNYVLDKPEFIYDSLRLLAIQELQKKMKNYSVLGFPLQAASQTLAEKIEILSPRYDFYQPQSSLRLPNAKITEAKKSPTYFYSPLLNASQTQAFDRVLGQKSLLPCLQIIFSLKTRVKVHQNQKN
jgi:hypothetical protein